MELWHPISFSARWLLFTLKSLLTKQFKWMSDVYHGRHLNLCKPSDWCKTVLWLTLRFIFYNFTRILLFQTLVWNGFLLINAKQTQRPERTSKPRGKRFICHCHGHYLVMVITLLTLCNGESVLFRCKCPNLDDTFGISWNCNLINTLLLLKSVKEGIHYRAHTPTPLFASF